MHMVRRTF